MTVRSLMLDEAVADCATASGAIDDRNRRRQFASHAVGEMTRGDVDGTAGSQQYCHFDRFTAWELLGCRRCNSSRGHQDACDGNDFGSRDRTHTPSTTTAQSIMLCGRLLHGAQRWSPFHS